MHWFIDTLTALCAPVLTLDTNQFSGSDPSYIHMQLYVITVNDVSSYGTCHKLLTLFRRSAAKVICRYLHGEPVVPSFADYLGNRGRDVIRYLQLTTMFD